MLGACVLTENAAGSDETASRTEGKSHSPGAPRRTHNAGTIPLNPADLLGESNGQLDSKVSLGGQFASCTFTTRTVTKLAEVCNLESEYDASRRRLARKQEIKRHPLEVVMVCCLVMWCCG